MLLRYNNEAAPHQGAAFLFMLFARQADSAEPCARSTSLCSVRFLLLGLLFHDALPCSVGPLSQSKQWQLGDERGVNRSWRRRTNKRGRRWRLCCLKPPFVAASCVHLACATKAPSDRTSKCGSRSLPEETEKESSAGRFTCRVQGHLSLHFFRWAPSFLLEALRMPPVKCTVRR